MVTKKTVLFLLVLFFCEFAFAEKGGRELPSHLKKPQIVKKATEGGKDNFYASLNLGIVVPSGLGAGFGFDLRGGYEFPFQGLRLRTGLRTGFYSGSDKGSVESPEIGGAMPYKLSVSGIPLFLEGILIFNPDEIIKPFAGLGLGSTYIKSNEDFFGYSNEESRWNPGIELSGGSFFYLGSFELLFELRYTFLPVHFVTTGNANLTGLGVFVGGGIRF